MNVVISGSLEQLWLWLAHPAIFSERWRMTFHQNHCQQRTGAAGEFRGLHADMLTGTSGLAARWETCWDQGVYLDSFSHEKHQQSVLVLLSQTYGWLIGLILQQTLSYSLYYKSFIFKDSWVSILFSCPLFSSNVSFGVKSSWKGGWKISNSIREKTNLVLLICH